MVDKPKKNNRQQGGNRFRLPGIDRIGIAQLSLIETALWPLDPSTVEGSEHETTYAFTSRDGKRSQAKIRVRAPNGIRSNDEYILWGLLAITLKHSDPLLVATPYWMLKELGMPCGGTQYLQLRDALLRLADVGYYNSNFYNPNTQEHTLVKFSFLSVFLPLKHQNGPVDTDRSWHVEWQPSFFKMCQASGGRLLFDLDLYRKFSPASRRLFLKLKDRFWRDKQVHLNVNDLTINGLGFARTVPLKVRKQKLSRCILELLEHKIIAFGRGQTDAKDLYIKKGKGSYVVVFHKGSYFECTEVAPSPQSNIENDPLYEPLKKIGFEDQAIRRFFRKHQRGVIQRWVEITQTAMHENPKGFPGFKVSPAAFCCHGIQNNHMPPDWVYSHEKELRRRQWEAETVHCRDEEQELRKRYQKERKEALKAFIQGDGRPAFKQAYETLCELHKHISPRNYQREATEAAINKIEANDFSFPEFSTWSLDQ